MGCRARDTRSKRPRYVWKRRKRAHLVENNTEIIKFSVQIATNRNLVGYGGGKVDYGRHRLEDSAGLVEDEQDVAGMQHLGQDTVRQYTEGHLVEFESLDHIGYLALVQRQTQMRPLVVLLDDEPARLGVLHQLPRQLLVIFY